MKLKTTQICHLECGVVKAAGREIDIPAKEAKKLIEAGKAVAIEVKPETTKPKLKSKK